MLGHQVIVRLCHGDKVPTEQQQGKLLNLFPPSNILVYFQDKKALLGLNFSLSKNNMVRNLNLKRMQFHLYFYSECKPYL